MKELLPRERFIRALRHEPLDRVPLLYRMKHEAKEKLARVYGITDAATGRKHNPELELRLGNDAIIYQIGINADFSHRPIAIGETWFNHFGVGYGKSGLKGRSPEEQVEFAKTQEFWGPAKVVPENFPKHHPITSPEEFKNYEWPDPADPALLDPIRTICDKYQDDYFIIVDLSSTLIEAAYAHIVGTQNFFLYMFDQPELIEGVLDGLTQYYTELGVNAIKAGADMIRVGDDVGAQQSMMVSPKQWRELGKPRFESMFNAFRKENPDIFIKLHSCGGLLADPRRRGGARGDPLGADAADRGTEGPGRDQAQARRRHRAVRRLRRAAAAAARAGRGGPPGGVRRDEEPCGGQRVHLLSVPLHPRRRAGPEHLHDAGGAAGLRHLRQVSAELMPDQTMTHLPRIPICPVVLRTAWRTDDWFSAIPNKEGDS